MARDADLRIEKERLLHMAESHLVLEQEQASGILHYWNTRLENVDEVDELSVLRDMVEEMTKDLDRLRDVRERLRMNKENEQARETEQILSRLLRLLDALFDKLQRKFWRLRLRTWRQLGRINPGNVKRHTKLDEDKSKPDAQKRAAAILLQEERKRSPGDEKEFD